MDMLETNAFAEKVHSRLERYHVPGIAIAVAHHNETTSKAFGLSCLDPPRRYTTNGLFDAASMSKSMTAAAIAVLMDLQGQEGTALDWATTMSSLLPHDFVMSEDSYTAGVTIEDVLSHRSGLPAHDLSYLGQTAKEPDSAASVTRNLRNLSVSAPIRSKWQYCNLMYTVATHLLEHRTNASFARFLQEHFFDPLQMTSSYLQPDAVTAAGQSERIVTGYIWDEDKAAYKKLPLQQTPEAQGAGSIFTSVEDWIKWVKALMNCEGPITKKIRDDLVQPRIMVEPERPFEKLEPFTSPSLYALGLFVQYYRGYRLISHGGLNYGFASSFFFLPEHNFGGVLTANASNAADMLSVIERELIDDFLGVPMEQRPDWEAVVERADEHDEGEEESRQDELLRKMGVLDVNERETMKQPLTDYTGAYHNTGYHTLVVQIKDEQLYVDASDRCMGFWLSFEHIHGGTKFIAHLDDDEVEDAEIMAAEFVIEADKIVRMGINFEPDDLDLTQMVWFDRISHKV